jgi:rhodanese-related sulfurtransferase
VDTHINSIDPVPSLFISAQELTKRLSRADAPLLLDVRPQVRFDASKYMLAGAQRCNLADVPAFAATLYAAYPQQEVVAYCVYGHHVSFNAATALRAAGLTAHALAGGFEGGEDGVDSAQEISLWRSAQLPTVEKDKR